MNDSTNVTSEENYSPNLIVSYLNLIIIGLGVIGNTVSFFIFRFHSSFKKMPSMVFLSFVAVTDTIALFEWNLDHYFQLVHRIDILSISLFLCRFLDFVQYSSLQASALIMSVMCVDRYVTVMAMPGSFLQKLPFRTIKSAIIWSSGVVLFCCFLNLYLVFHVGMI